MRERARVVVGLAVVVVVAAVVDGSGEVDEVEDLAEVGADITGCVGSSTVIGVVLL